MKKIWKFKCKCKQPFVIFYYKNFYKNVFTHSKLHLYIIPLNWFKIEIKLSVMQEIKKKKCTTDKFGKIEKKDACLLSS